MSNITIFDFRKFSQYTTEDKDSENSELPATPGQWYHHPARTQLAATFVHQIDVIHIFVYHSGKRLVRASINKSREGVKFVAQYPSIGFKQSVKGKLVKRFQMGFGDKVEFDRCVAHIQQLNCEIKITDTNGPPHDDWESKNDTNNENLWIDSQMAAQPIKATPVSTQRNDESLVVQRGNKRPQESLQILEQVLQQLIHDPSNPEDNHLRSDSSYILSLSKEDLCKLLSEKLKQKEFLNVLKKIDDAITNEYK